MAACSPSPPVALEHTGQQLREDQGSMGQAERHFCTVPVNHTLLVLLRCLKTCVKATGAR